MAADAHGAGPELLADARWSCGYVSPGSVGSPDELTGSVTDWVPADVPGTVAGALRAAGWPEPTRQLLDGRDWWFRCRFPGPRGPAAAVGWVLAADGLATLADVWLNGVHLLHSDSMYDHHRIDIDTVAEDNELCLRFAALTPVLEQRRPRPRWKAMGVDQNLRWIRTSLLGRQAGWAAVPPVVGPWRGLSLRPAPPVEIVRRHVLATCGPGPAGRTDGTVVVDLTVRGPALPADAPATVGHLAVGGAVGDLEASAVDGGVRLTGSVDLEGVERWWPHTHGAPRRYPVRAVVAGVTLDLGAVGFRTVVADRSDGGFRLVVNDVPVFCRGAGWYPVDPVTHQSSDDDLAATIDLVRRAGMNMLRIPGDTVYEIDRFFDECDRVGILVWQDAMLGPVDPPADETFVATVTAEVASLLERTSGHPSLAVLCGGQQIQEQAALFGLSRDRWPTPLVDTDLAELAAALVPGVAYLQGSPSGGDLPVQADAGVCHYVGVGIHLFPLDDLRRASPRFVSEGLAFSIPPERRSVAGAFGGDPSRGHESDWKRGVHRDAGSWFDLEDVRDHYAAILFSTDMADLRRSDHERALDLGRAAMAEVMARAVAEWRRTGSPCDGLLHIAFRDLRAGPGWGLVDSSGCPKAPWYAVARASTPVAVLTTDEGVNGLGLHVVNDTAEPVEATLVLGLHTAAHRVEEASCPVTVPSRGGLEVRAEHLLDGFRDLTYAFCFGPRGYELVTVDLVDGSGRVIAAANYLPGGPARDLDPAVGLQTELRPVDGGQWLLCVSSHRFAQYVQVDVPGYLAEDSWFHLPPGGSRTLCLVPGPGPGAPDQPRGRVRALNTTTEATVALP